jgi:ATP-dependent Zn protease
MTIAYHEAGHAVIGRVLGIVCGPASIVPDATTAGHAVTQGPLTILDAWDARGRSRFNDLRSAYRASIMQAMAGREADRGNLTGDSGDRQDIEALLRRYDLDAAYFGLPCSNSTDFPLDRLRKATRGLCRRHRERIERIAQALLKHETLSPEKIDNLMRRS